MDDLPQRVPLSVAQWLRKQGWALISTLDFTTAVSLAPLPLFNVYFKPVNKLDVVRPRVDKESSGAGFLTLETRLLEFVHTIAFHNTHLYSLEKVRHA